MNTLIQGILMHHKYRLLIAWVKRHWIRFALSNLFFNITQDANLISEKKIFTDSNLKLTRDTTLAEREYFSKVQSQLNTRIANGELNLNIMYIKGLHTIVPKYVQDENVQ